MQSERDIIERETEAPRDGEASRRQRVQADNAAARALASREQREQAPRLRAKANAADAKLTVIEALGVHDKRPAHAGTDALIADAAKALTATFASMEAALDSPQLDGLRAVTMLAERGQAAIAAHVAQFAQQRGILAQLEINVADRAAKATIPPAHLVAQVSDARVALRSMTEDERYKLIDESRGDTREVLMYAIGGAVAFLTGVSQAKQKEMRRTLLAVRDPSLLDLEPAIPAALAALDKAEAGMRRLIGSVVDFDAAKALQEL